MVSTGATRFDCMLFPVSNNINHGVNIFNMFTMPFLPIVNAKP